MGVPREQATRNRQAIIDTASRVFRQRGVDGVGLADLMKEAGFTHGGFYNHFTSKDALAAEACASAFARGAADLQHAVEADAAGGHGGFRALLEAYLSPAHCEEPGTGCPTATLAIDAARQGKDIQAAYAAGIAKFVEVLTPFFDAGAEDRDADQTARESAIALLAGMVGALVLARGVGAANQELSNEILAAARKRLAI